MFLYCLNFFFNSSADVCGLLPDQFAHKFTATPHHNHPRKHRKPPLINRGTFIRTIAIDSYLRRFLVDAGGSKCQVVSLGAGFDTRYFRLVSERGNCQYFEIDFDSVIASKEAVIKADSELSNLNSNLHLIACDLNELGTLETILHNHPQFDASLQTLFIAECLFMYLRAEAVDALLQFASRISNSKLIAFDPVISDDSFSRVMQDNLQDRGVEPGNLLSLPQIKSRFSAHFGKVEVFSMAQLEADDETLCFVSLEDRKTLRIKAALDEYEEWFLLAGHYYLVTAEHI